MREGAGGVAVLEGPPGIGRTELLQSAIADARAEGMTVLHARGGELERELPFGVVRQLFEPLVARASGEARAGLLAGPARLAGPLFDGGPATPIDELPRDETSFAVLNGLYRLTANAATEGPVLMAVDDLHWCDLPSLRFLVYLAKRVEDLPVLALVSKRSFEAGAPLELLDELTWDPLAATLSLRSLSDSATTHLIRDRLSRGADERFCAACHAVTGGNPFLLHALIDVLRERAVPPAAERMAEVARIGPPSVARWVLRSIRRVPDAPALAAAVAVLGEGATLHLAAELAGLDAARAHELADTLARAGILRRGRPLFVHPVVREAIYSHLAPRERTALHRRAARLLSERGQGDDQVAAHLLAGDPDGDQHCVEVLRRAARSAVARGAPDAAVTYLSRALAEPPEGDTRAAVLLELGLAETTAGGAGALDHLRRALSLARDLDQRAEVALEVARVLFSVAGFAEAAEVLRSALDRLGDRRPDLARRLEAELLGVSLFDLSTLPPVSGRLGRAIEEVGAGAVDDPAALASAAIATTASVEPASRGAALAERALAVRRRGTEDNPLVLALSTAALVGAEELGRAAAAWEEALAEARRGGSRPDSVLASAFCSHVAWRRGAITKAEAYARDARELAVAPEARFGKAFAAAALLDALIERGLVDDATRVLVESRFEAALPEVLLANALLDSRGRLHMALGRHREALDDFRECGRRLEAWGSRNPALVPWRSNAALALAALGEDEEAREIARVEVDLARRFAVPRALGMALRASGLVERPERRLELLEEAAAVLERSPAALERARALTDVGAELRRRGERVRARAPLRRALALAQRCGVPVLAERAHEELLISGARPRRASFTGVDSLTAGERRVVEMASEGLTNRQIARALFLTEKTIERHLSHAYRKLDVKARSQLPQVLRPRV